MVFVHGGVRGEVCSVRILKVLKNMAFGRVEEIFQPSPAAPGKNRSHGVGGGLLALEVAVVVAGDGSVGGLIFGGAVGGDQDRGHLLDAAAGRLAAKLA